MESLLSAFETIQVTQGLYLIAFLVLLVYSGLMFRNLWEDERQRLRWPLLLFLLAMVLRLGWIAFTQPEPVSDYEIYWRMARDITHGNLVFDNAEKHPGIILLLSYVQSLLGMSYWAGWVLNLIFSAVTLGAIYAITRRIFNRSAALLALALAAIHPQLISFSALMASELPALAFMLVITWAVLTSEKHRKQWLFYWIGMGVLLYGAVLTRSTYLLFIGLIPLLLIVFRRENLGLIARQFAVLLVTAGVLISTWSVHQYLITGSPKLFWGSELWLYSTAQYGHEGRFVQPQPGIPVYPKIREDWESGTQAGRRRALLIIGQDARAMLMADPVRYLKFGFTRMRHILWTTAEAGIRSSQEGSAWLQALPEKTVTRMAEISKHFSRVILLLSLLGLSGFWLTRTRQSLEGLFLIGSYLVCWLGFHYLMAISSDRWAVQIAPYIVIFAGGGLGLLMQWIVARAPGTVAQKPELESTPGLPG